MPVTPIVQRQIAQKHDSGKSLKRISDETGLNKHIVQKCIKEHEANKANKEYRQNKMNSNLTSRL